MSDPHFRLDFSTSINSGKIVEHAASTILRHIGAVTQRYKIGVTHLPYTRFYKKYKNKDFCFLVRLQNGRWGFKGWIIGYNHARGLHRPVYRMLFHRPTLHLMQTNTSTCF